MMLLIDACGVSSDFNGLSDHELKLYCSVLKVCNPSTPPLDMFCLCTFTSMIGYAKVQRKERRFKALKTHGCPVFFSFFFSFSASAENVL